MQYPNALSSDEPGQPPSVAFNKGRRRAVLAGIAGNVLEWYDFGIYGFLAATLAKNFFPSSDQYASLLATFAVFGVGFVARPVGSVVLGRMADIKGRKAVLTLTVILMGASTVAIGLLPSYATVGLLAPVLLVIARFLQGFSAGGEWGSASTFLYEWAGRGRRGFVGAFQQSTIGVGLLLAAAISGLLSSTMSSPALADWGWRIPFLLGGLLGPVGAFMRSNVDESPDFEEARSKDSASLEADMFWRRVLQTFALGVFWSGGAYLVLVYMATFAHTYLSISHVDALWSSALALFIFALFSPAMGALSDRIGRKPLLMMGCTLFIIGAYPMYRLLIVTGSIGALLAVQGGMALIYSMYSGPGPAMVSEMFPTRVRATGVSIGIGLSALTGGFAPMVATWAIRVTGAPENAGFLLSGFAVISLLALLSIRMPRRSEVLPQI